MDFKFENILYEKKEGIAWITFNRPEKMNPLSSHLVEETERVARRIAANAPLALEMMKHFVNRGVEEGYSWSRDATSALITTQDLKEGTDAFLGKRKPQFKGR